MTQRSINPDHPVDPVVIDILRSVAEEARAEGIDFMLVGATARDILLTHVFGLATRRATYDVDFAVAVMDWQQFAALRNRLIARGTFRPAGAAQQRLYYQRAKDDPEYPLDLVPFGLITQGGNEIAWPPDMQVVMNVAGYDDALAAAEVVAFAADVEANVVSLAGLAILKLVAWSDRGRDNPKDAHDLIHLMNNYAVAGNFDRVYSEDGVIEAGDYNPDLAGVYLLAKDVRLIAGVGTNDVLNKIIARDFDRLSRDMVTQMRHFDNADDMVAARLRLFRRGLAQA